MTDRAVLLIAFGGPTSRGDVRPFLDNVLRGRRVPPDRVEAVVQHYELIGGCSPLTALTFRQARALEAELRAAGPPLPVYVGMRNWTPYLSETLERMTADGVARAIAVVMAPQRNDASWERYARDVAAAQARIGPHAPEVDYVETWHAHPLFIEAVSEGVAAVLEQIPAARRRTTAVVFTAHSIPTAMVNAPAYVEQITEAARLVAERVGHRRWLIAYQSRSGGSHEAWLEPDICDVISQLACQGVGDVVVVPVGFVCDHVEVLYDLDVEARRVAGERGVNFLRAATVNDHPAFIRMLADVVRRRLR
ncbi:MAG: ferrochelatase [Candidatus Binatia bacterium]